MGFFTRLKVLVTRLAIKTIGRSSCGIRIVTTIGLTSGIMLDYIYQNTPQGTFFIGRWIDKLYLSHPAWEDVRIRKKNLEVFLIKAIEIQKNSGRTPVILDVAAGSARYILDTLSREDISEVKAVCRDLDTDALALGKESAAARGLSSITFESGDAFDVSSLTKAGYGANIIVSSGFYDWITDNDMVRESMSLIFGLLPSGGCFLFTNQSRHVSYEFTQAVFSDHKGEPLRMSLRPAQQVNEWAEAIGFAVIETTGDDNTNYSVTLTKKP